MYNNVHPIPLDIIVTKHRITVGSMFAQRLGFMWWPGQTMSPRCLISRGASDSQSVMFMLAEGLLWVMVMRLGGTDITRGRQVVVSKGILIHIRRKLQVVTTPYCYRFSEMSHRQLIVRLSRCIRLPRHLLISTGLIIKLLIACLRTHDSKWESK